MERVARTVTKPMTREIHRRIIIDKNSDYRAAVLLAGSGRSGTTWVSKNIINHRNEYRYMFEPFHPARVPACSHFKNRQYLRPDNCHQQFLKPAEFIFTGQIRNKWTDRENTKVVCSKRLIKDIRVNLSLKWIHTNFPGIPIILLFRHPCAVAASQIQQKWKTWLDDLLSQEDLMEDFFVPFRREIEKAKTDFEKHVFLWSMENYVPLKQFNRGEIHLAFYENFCVNPEDETGRLFSFLGKEPPQLASVNWSRAASTGFRQRHPDQESLINSWKKHVSEAETQTAMEILRMFGLDQIYTAGLMPNPKAAVSLMSAN